MAPEMSSTWVMSDQVSTAWETPSLASTSAALTWNLFLMLSTPQGFFWLPRISLRDVVCSKTRPSLRVMRIEFTCEDYKKPGGTAIHTYPAIKFPEDRDALQQGLADGSLCTTATDEYTTYKDVKLSGDTIFTVCGGHNGIETRLPVTYTKLVSTGRISLERFAAITSSNAAKILGMYPKKGAIAVGSDADIVIFDPDMTKTLTLDDLHADSDYSIWEGFECHGFPVMTILRGNVIVEDGRLTGNTSIGRWLSRKVAPGVLARPVC